MSKEINEGSVIEGIFALAAGVYLKNGTVKGSKWSSQFTSKEVQDLRQFIKPAEWETGSSIVQLVKDPKKPIVLRIGKNKPDYIKKIEVSIRLKMGEAGMAFGSSAAVIKFTSTTLKDKLDTLSKLFSQLSVGRQLSEAINGLLANKESDYMNWYVIADGVGGEQTGGKIKADVVIRLKVEHMKNGRVIEVKTKNIQFNYSLKSDSKTWANLSPWDSTMEMIRDFNLDNLNSLDESTIKSFARSAGESAATINALTWPPKTKKSDENTKPNLKLTYPQSWKTPSPTVPNCYLMITGADTDFEKKQKQKETLKTVAAFHKLIDKKLKEIKNTPAKLGQFSSQWWNFLLLNGVGTDEANIIDLRTNNVSEVSPLGLKKLVTESKKGTQYLLSQVKLERGNVVIFYIHDPDDIKKQIPVFSFRMRAEYRIKKGKAVLFTKFLFEYEAGLKKLNVFQKSK